MSKASTIKAIYRCVLSDAMALERVPQFRLRNALQLEQWGAGQYVPLRTTNNDNNKEPIRIRSLESYFDAQKRGFRFEEPTESVVEMVRQSFKENMHLTDRKLIGSKLDEAIAYEWITTTKGVRIEATSQYVASHSDPQENVFRFTYRVTITNQNVDTPIQITGRQYTFMSERRQRIALPRHSPGIVGNTPVLQPGQTFEYASGVDIDAPHGVALGCLHTVRHKQNENDPIDEDDVFDAYVSQFHFIAPGHTTEK